MLFAAVTVHVGRFTVVVVRPRHLLTSPCGFLLFSQTFLLSPSPASGLDHRSGRLRGVLLRGRVRLPAELLHERHQPRHRANPRE